MVVILLMQALHRAVAVVVLEVIPGPVAQEVVT
jgi:hypothetical protein